MNIKYRHIKDRAEIVDGYGLLEARWFGAYDVLVDGEVAGIAIKVEDGPWQVQVNGKKATHRVRGVAVGKALGIYKEGN